MDWQNRLGVLAAHGVTVREPRLKSFVDEWRTERVSGLKESTRHQYACTASQLLAFFGPKTTVRKAFTVSRAQAYVGSLVRAGRKPATIDLHLAVLSSLARYAVDTGALDLNPVPKVQRPRKSAPLPQAYSASEVRAIIAAAPREHRDLIEFLFVTGVRRSEAAGLTAAQMLPPRGLSVAAPTICTEVVIDRRVWRGRVDTPKSGIRRVPVGPHCGTMLARRVASLKPDDLVFPAPGGGYIDWQRWTTRVWEPTLRRAGVSLSGVHSTRRSSATALLEFAAPQVVGQRLGMSTAVLLRHYSATLDEAATAAASAVEDAMLGVSAPTRRAKSA